MFNKINNDSGAALVTALLVLAVLTLLGMAAILTSTTDVKISGNERATIEGQYAAEAGISHTMVFLGYTTVEPTVTWSATENPAAENWAYIIKDEVKDGTKTFFNYSVRIEYKKINRPGSAYHERVAFFNKTSGYSSAQFDAGGFPVLRIISVARRGGFQTQENILEVTRNYYDYQVKGGLTAGGSLTYGGNSTIDGQHHDIDGNIVGTGSGCKSPDLSAPMPAVFANGTTIKNGSSAQMSSSPGITDNTVDSAAVPTSPWEALGMLLDDPNPNAVDFKSIFPNYPAANPYNNGDSLHDDQYYTTDVTNLADASGNGNGLLVVHNPNFTPGLCDCIDGTTFGFPDCWNATNVASDADCAAANAPAKLDISGNDIYKGLIIADEVRLRGGVQIIGGLVSLTTVETEKIGNGTPSILYSCQAIEKFAAGGTFKKLNWHKE